MRNRLFLVLCVGATNPGWAQDASVPTLPAGGGLLPLALNLLLVLGIIVLLGWFVSRSSRFGQQHNGSLDIVATRMVGNRERLVVVQVGNEQVLLGVTASQITPLHTLREPLVAQSEQPSVAGGFAARLSAMRRAASDSQETQS